VVRDFCLVAPGPILIDPENRDTQGTMAQIDAYNAIWEEFCE